MVEIEFANQSLYEQLRQAEAKAQQQEGAIEELEARATRMTELEEQNIKFESDLETAVASVAELTDKLDNLDEIHEKEKQETTLVIRKECETLKGQVTDYEQ